MGFQWLLCSYIFLLYHSYGWIVCPLYIVAFQVLVITIRRTYVIINLFRDLLAPEIGNESGIDINCQIMGGEKAIESLLNIFTVAIAQVRYLLFTIDVSINSFRVSIYMLWVRPLCKTGWKTLHVLCFHYGSSLKKPDRNYHCDCVEYEEKTQRHDYTNDGNEGHYIACAHSLWQINHVHAPSENS